MSKWTAKPEWLAARTAQRRIAGHCVHCGNLSDRATDAKPHLACTPCYRRRRENKRALIEAEHTHRTATIATDLQAVAAIVADLALRLDRQDAKLERVLQYARRAYRAGYGAGHATGRTTERREFIAARSEWEQLRGQSLHLEACDMGYKDMQQATHRVQEKAQ